MKNDLINTLNRLTSSEELADLNLLDDIVENCYEKFKYFNTLLDTVDIDKTISEIKCNETKNSLRVIIEPKDASYMNNIIFNINNNKNNYTFSKHFSLNIIESGDSILIEIKSKNNIKEGDMYDSRFVWYGRIY